MSVAPTARATIRPAAITANLARIRERAPAARVLAAIKGNAYGHGLLTAAAALGDADAFAVARLGEAARLREAGVGRPLVLLAGVADAGELATASNLDCDLVVHNTAQLRLLESTELAAFTVWLKVDTGMHRLGFAPAAVPAVLDRLAAARSVGRVRLMTHLATADDDKDPLGTDQCAAFRKLARGFAGDISIANSAALYAGEAGAGDWGHVGETWIRPGIALYGISPFAEHSGAELGLKPAMRFESRLVDVKPLARGARVGYGGHWRSDRDTVLGIVAAGYADGYTRFLPSGTPVLVNGRRAGLAGIVSMDLAAVDLGPGAKDAPGDPVLLWGDELPVETVARAAGTIAYQLVTGLTHREPPRILD